MPKRQDLLLQDALIQKKIASKKDLEPFLKEADSSVEGLHQVLLKHKAFPEEDILVALADKLGIAFLRLKELSLERNVLEKVPLKVATYYRMVPVSLEGRSLTVAVSYPLDVKIQDEIRTQLGYDIDIALACSADIADTLQKYYGLGADTLEKISSGVSEHKSGQDAQTETVDDIEKMAGDASVIRLVNQIILEAFKKRATDIHIEPHRGGLNLRYRIDGLLYDANVASEVKNYLAAIISRIKIMSNLNIVERRLPQDGRAIVKVGDQMLDLRISTIPTPFAESIVIRILPTQMLFSLQKLGLAKRELDIFEKLIQKPHGIIFVTGPTGSGKTTTLYTCLSQINTKERKIITIEDPIEYEMPGVTQIQVMPEIGLDFARGLRSILRHDPDVIMVGEVRDLETAEIAIRVALTGHLVFSSLHTNDAASGITRLLDIGVEPFLLASSVEAFIAQRLIRLVCPDCKTEDKNVPLELKEMIAKDLRLHSADEVKIFRGKGCPNCNSTGFFGRTAVYEVLLIDEEIKELILKKTSSSQIKKTALEKGMCTLRQDGWQRVLAGLTTPEEIIKVAPAEGSADGEARIQPNYAGRTESINRRVFDPSDKRVFLRLKSKLNLRYRVFKSKEEVLRQAFNPEVFSVTENVSAGGLLFFSDEPLAINSILELKIELPESDKMLECLSKVIRIEDLESEHGFYVAVCFMDLSGHDRLRLNKHVESQM
jgi:type II secretory ATPase GspE/PulE/Tfp pilus assembly ATPase PilB-like protein